MDLTGPPRPWPEPLVARFGEALAKAMSAADRWSTPPPFGDRGLLERLGELFGAPQGRTMVTGGVRSFASAWSGRTRCAVVERPSFTEVPEILAAAGPVRSVPWERLPATAREMGESTTVWLTTPARNPDGRSLDGGQLDALAELADEGHQVLLNQIYRWYAPTEPAPSGIWTVNSLSKLCGGGSRLGWVTVPPSEQVDTALRSSAPATVWQRAWAHFLDRRVLANLRSACIEPTIDARRAFEEEMSRLLGWEFSGVGLSLVLRCRAAQDATARRGTLTETEAMALLAEAGVSVSPGAAFGMPVVSVRLAFSGVSAAQARDAANRIARLAGPTGLRLQPWCAS